MFTCETVGGGFSWIVNGTLREVVDPEIRRDLMISEIIIDGGSTVETLTIPARAEYNGTRVQCLVFTVDGPRAESGNATLVIQGIEGVCVFQYGEAAVLLLGSFALCVGALLIPHHIS